MNFRSFSMQSMALQSKYIRSTSFICSISTIILFHYNFLKFQFLYYQNLGLEELSLYPLATEVDEILQMGTGRCVRSDWLVFYIALFSQYYDVDEIKGFISKKLWSPSQLFQRLGVNNRKDAFSKCMQYAFAINDMDFLLYNKV